MKTINQIIMKKLKLLGLAAGMLAGTLLFSSCIGSFSLTTKLYNWNNSVGGKWANELVFLAFCILPVYDATVFIDAVVLNTIEFWTGSNPVSMNEDEKEIQYVKSGDREYSITAVKNKFVIQQLSGPRAGETAEILFNPEEQSCYLNYRGESTRLAEYVSTDNGQDKVNLFLPEGKMICLNAGERDIDLIRATLRSATSYMAMGD